MHARRPTCARRRARQCGLFRNRRWRREITQREAVTPKEGGAGWAALQRGRPRVAGIQGRHGGPASGGRERAARGHHAPGVHRRRLLGRLLRRVRRPAAPCLSRARRAQIGSPANAPPRWARSAPLTERFGCDWAVSRPGRARRLFEPMDLEMPGRFTMSHRDSVMLAEDVSALIGSQVSMDGARPGRCERPLVAPGRSSGLAAARRACTRCSRRWQRRALCSAPSLQAVIHKAGLGWRDAGVSGRQSSSWRAFGTWADAALGAAAGASCLARQRSDARRRARSWGGTSRWRRRM